MSGVDRRGAGRGAERHLDENERPLEKRIRGNRPRHRDRGPPEGGREFRISLQVVGSEGGMEPRKDAVGNPAAETLKRLDSRENLGGRGLDVSRVLQEPRRSAESDTPILRSGRRWRG